MAAAHLPVSTDPQVLDNMIVENLSKGQPVKRNELILENSSHVYADDIMIQSPTDDSRIKKLKITSKTLPRPAKSDKEIPILLHLAFLNRVLYCLEEANFLLSSTKINILCHLEGFEYLGYSFRGNIISIAQKTIDTIQALPDPKTLKETQKIIGMTVYLGQILRHGRVLTGFLSDKCKKGVVYKFTDDDSKKFQKLKNLLCKVHMKGYLYALDTNVKDKTFIPVSYTHLTLPTILLV